MQNSSMTICSIAYILYAVHTNLDFNFLHTYTYIYIHTDISKYGHKHTYNLQHIDANINICVMLHTPT